MIKNSMESVRQWFKTSLPLPENWFEAISSEPVPRHLKRWWFCLGGTPAYLLIIQIITGILLTFYYVPDPGHAYDSVKHITYNVQFGWIIRSVHKWASHLMVVAVILHVMRTFFTRAYRKPRELNWMIGCLILITTFVFGLTGYSLVYEQLSYWGATVAATLTQNAPLVGDFLARFMRGGDSIQENTLTRFFVLHVMLLPVAIFGLLAAHITLIRLHGVTELEFEEDKKDTRKSKHFPFFPNHLLTELVIGMVLAFILTILVVVFPAHMGPPADPFNTPAHIKPEWYFYFTFRWLKLTSLQVGVIGPGLAAGLLIGWPFVDRLLEKKFPGKDASVYFGIVGVLILVWFTVWEALV